MIPIHIKASKEVMDSGGEYYKRGLQLYSTSFGCPRTNGIIIKPKDVTLLGDIGNNQLNGLMRVRQRDDM